MLKKMTLLAISVFALAAFAAPAVAQAQKLYELSGTTHVDLAVGAKVTATSTNLVTTVTANGAKLICAKVTIHGEVTENKANKSRIENNTVTTEGCNNIITKPAVGRITLQGAGAGTAANATFISDEPVECHWAGNIPFSYVTNTDVLTVTPDPVTVDQFFGNCGHAFMEGSFTLETSDGTPVYIT